MKDKNWEEQNSTLNEAEDEAVSSMAGSVSMLDKMNDLSRASLDNWGVQLHNDHLYEQMHLMNLSHGPSKIRPDNKFASVGFVMELMIDEVHLEMVDQGFIPNDRNKLEQTNQRTKA